LERFGGVGGEGLSGGLRSVGGCPPPQVDAAAGAARRGADEDRRTHTRRPLQPQQTLNPNPSNPNPEP
jgi:hypothetical protein